MSWLKDKLRNWILRDDPEDSMQTVSPKRGRVGALSAGRSFETRGMNFTVYQANGGHILEYNFYDTKRDESETRLHIITADQDLGQGIAHIITYEMLRK
jgi:hypothetical protein